MSRLLLLAIAVAGCFTPISRLEGGNVLSRLDGGLDAGSVSVDAGIPLVRPPAGPDPVCLGGSPLTRYLRGRLAEVDAGCVGCLLHVRERTVEPVFVSTPALQLEDALEDGATATWAVFTTLGNGRALHVAPMDAGVPFLITPLEVGELVTGRWIEGRFVFARSSGRPRGLGSRDRPSRARAAAVGAALPSAERPLQPAPARPRHGRVPLR